MTIVVEVIEISSIWSSFRKKTFKKFSDLKKNHYVVQQSLFNNLVDISGNVEP